MFHFSGLAKRLAACQAVYGGEPSGTEMFHFSGLAKRLAARQAVYGGEPSGVIL